MTIALVLSKPLKQDDYDILVVEHKDRLSRFATNYMDVLLSRLGIRLEIVNIVDNRRSGIDDRLGCHYNVVCSTSLWTTQGKAQNPNHYCHIASGSRKLNNVKI